MLKDFGMEGCEPAKTPMVPGLHLERPTTPLSPEEIEFMKDKPYLHAIGKLIWLANGTRPDITYAAGGGSAVSWSSKLQSCIACSTTEAEFFAGES